MAEAAKITMGAMKLEVDKAFRRRVAQEKKRQEKIDLEPMKALQPKDRSIRYDNMKSAMAEDGILCQVLRDPSLMDSLGRLTPESFSVPLLGRVFAQLLNRHRQGLEVQLGVLEDITPEEMAHLTGVLQRHQGPVNEKAFRDCIRTVLTEHQEKTVSSDADLLALRNKLKESKGTKT